MIPLPWRQWRELAFGVLGLSRSDFYDYSWNEWMAALSGYRISQGIDTRPKPATSAELKQLAKYAAPSKSIRVA